MAYKVYFTPDGFTLKGNTVTKTYEDWADPVSVPSSSNWTISSGYTTPVYVNYDGGVHTGYIGDASQLDGLTFTVYATLDSDIKYTITYKPDGTSISGSSWSETINTGSDGYAQITLPSWSSHSSKMSVVYPYTLPIYYVISGEQYFAGDLFNIDGNVTAIVKASTSGGGGDPDPGEPDPPTTEYSRNLYYNVNGGSGAPSTQYGSVSTSGAGYTHKISSTIPTRTGYTFKEWNTASDGSGAAYQPSKNITIYSDRTLYAIWNGGYVLKKGNYQFPAGLTYLPSASIGRVPVPEDGLYGDEYEELHFTTYPSFVGASLTSPWEEWKISDYYGISVLVEDTLIDDISVNKVLLYGVSSDDMYSDMIVTAFTDGICIDTDGLTMIISSDQEVSYELYTFITNNATYSPPLTIKGKWKLNAVINSEYISYQAVNFTSNNKAYTAIEYLPSGYHWSIDGVYATEPSELLMYNNDAAYMFDGYLSNGEYVTNHWINNAYKEIDFGNEPQEVSIGFYNWLIENAERIYEKIEITSATIENNTLKVVTKQQLDTKQVSVYVNNTNTPAQVFEVSDIKLDLTCGTYTISCKVSAENYADSDIFTVPSNYTSTTFIFEIDNDNGVTLATKDKLVANPIKIVASRAYLDANGLSGIRLNYLVVAENN